MTDEAEPAPTAIEAVFEKLISDIVGGAYPAGARLPAERELSRMLGASRPTLREALRRLGEWNLVEPRRGSGIVVRPYRDWSFEVVGAYLRYGKPTDKQPSIAKIIIDLFALRRAVVTEVIRMLASRIAPGGTQPARGAMARAWSLRDQVAYAREDFEVMRLLCEAAQYTPGMWMLNRIASLWTDAAEAMRFAVHAPADYVQVHTKLFELLEAGEGDAATKHMSEYLERHDSAMIGMLSAFAGAAKPASAT